MDPQKIINNIDAGVENGLRKASTTGLNELGYEMSRAYLDYGTQGEAVEHVKDKYPDADLNVLWAMWWAIDAHSQVGR